MEPLPGEDPFPLSARLLLPPGSPPDCRLHLVRPRESLRDPVTSTLIRAWDKGKHCHHPTRPFSRRPGSSPAPRTPRPWPQALGSSVPTWSRSAERKEAGRKWASRPSAASATSSQSACALAYSGASLGAELSGGGAGWQPLPRLTAPPHQPHQPHQPYPGFHPALSASARNCPVSGQFPGAVSLAPAVMTQPNSRLSLPWFSPLLRRARVALKVAEAREQVGQAAQRRRT